MDKVLLNNCLEVKYDTCKEFLDHMLWGNELNIVRGTLIFRGESTNNYKLLPTALRLNNKKILWEQAGFAFQDNEDNELEYKQIALEYFALRNFFLIADKRGLPVPQVPRLRQDIFDAIDLYNLASKPWISDDLLELAGLAQHYGICTRLLDWSSDLFVSLYFAASNAVKRNINNKKDGNLDADVDGYMVIWALDLDGIEYMRVGQLLNPLKVIRPAYFSNPNLSSQSGLFTLWEITCPEIMNSPQETVYNKNSIDLTDRKPFNEAVGDHMNMIYKRFPMYKEQYDSIPLLYKFLIPSSECYRLLDFLSKIRYDASKLFPGYTSIKDALLEKFITTKNSGYPWNT